MNGQSEGNGKSQEDFLIVNKTTDGYRVYSASQPGQQHFVHADLSNPACTCETFGSEQNCEHVRAVAEQLTEAERMELQERLAIQSGDPKTRKKRAATRSATPVTMTLKRSVSPDGRIDSLSVEFSCPLEPNVSSAIKSKAAGMLKLQSEIAAGFLTANGSPNNGNRQTPKRSMEEGGIAAKMLYVGTYNGRYGPRLFIAFQAKGQSLKLFGTAKQLAEVVSAAGYEYRESDIAEGIYLNLPCQILTRPSRDGRYTDIDRVLPDKVTSAQARGSL
jgi:hypothetical protein